LALFVSQVFEIVSHAGNVLETYVRKCFISIICLNNDIINVHFATSIQLLSVLLILICALMLQ